MNLSAKKCLSRINFSFNIEVNLVSIITGIDCVVHRTMVMMKFIDTNCGAKELYDHQWKPIYESLSTDGTQ